MNYDSCETSEAIMDILDAIEERRKQKVLKELRGEIAND